jgi:hypothetical protein
MADPSQITPGLQIAVPDNTPLDRVLGVTDAGAGKRALGFVAGGGLAAEAIRDLMGTTLVAGGGITITVDDNGDTITIAATGGVAQGGGYTLAVDPHDEMFGAKGDAVGFTRLRVSETVPGNGIWRRIYHDGPEFSFDEDDVGKLVFTPDTSWTAGNTARTIVSVNEDGSAVVDIDVSSWMGPQQLNAVVGTDDTAALQAALDYAQGLMMLFGEQTTGGTGGVARNAVGGKVRLRGGAGYICWTNEATYNAGAGKKAALLIPRRCGLEGEGIGQTVIYTPPGHRGHGIAFKQADTYAEQILLASFSLVCFGDINTDMVDGIHLDWAFDGYANADTFSRVRDVAVWRAGRHGFWLNGRGEGVFQNLQASFCNGVGIFANGMTDSVFIRCSAGGNQKTGIRIKNSAPTHWVACKSFYNGGSGQNVVAGGPDVMGQDQPQEILEGNCANWWLERADWDWGGAVILTSCEAQESVGSGFYIESGENQFANCHAADAGRISYGPAVGSRPAVRAGYHLAGLECHGNLFSNCFYNSELGRNDVPNMGFATAAVHVDGVDPQNRGPVNTRGQIYTPLPFRLRDNSGDWPGLQPYGGGDLHKGDGWTNGKNIGLRLNAVAAT